MNTSLCKVALTLVVATSGVVAGTAAIAEPLHSLSGAKATAQRPIGARVAGDEHLRKGQPAQALQAYREALSLEPEDELATLGLVQALVETGNPLLAWETARKTPRVFGSALLTDLRHRAAVALLRQAQASDGSSRNRALDQSIEMMRESELSGELTDSRASDLIVALSERAHHLEAVTLFERLSASSPSPRTRGAPVSQGVHPWAELPAAQSYSSLGRLDDARVLLEALHAAKPDDLQVTYALVYALSDLHRFEDATALLQTLAASLKAAQNAELPYALQLMARVRLWAGDRKGARAMVDTAQADHPGDRGLMRLRASIDRDGARGRNARDQLTVVENLDRDDLDTKLARVSLRSDESLSAAQQQLATVRAEAGDTPAVQRSAEELRRWRAMRVTVQGSSTADRDSTSQERVIRVTSRAVGRFDARAFVEHQSRQDELREQTVLRHHTTVGLQARLPGAGALSLETTHQPKSGSGIAVEWSGQPMDQLIARLRYRGLDTDVAARAHVQDVQSRSVEAAARWIQESGELSISVKQQDLTDGNTRRSMSGAWSGQLPAWGNARPAWVLRAGRDLASRTDVSYFSPSQSWWTDAEFSVALPKLRVPGTNQYLVLRPVVSLGTFNQATLSSQVTGSVGLGGSWEMTHSTIVGFSSALVRRPYDGKYTTQRMGSVYLNTRLP